MGKVNGTGCCEPWVFHGALLTATQERRQGEDANGNTSKGSAPPSGVPREHGLANDVANEACGHHELRQVFSPAKVTVGEQHVPVGEHEPCLGVGVGCTVKGWWNQPGVEEENGEHRGENNAVTQHLMRPKAMTSAGSLSLFLCFLQLRFLLHVHGGNSSEIVNQSHFSPSVSMRLRNALYPNDEQVNDDERGDDNGENEHVDEVHSSDRQRRQF